jgi:hypothetical protein
MFLKHESGAVVEMIIGKFRPDTETGGCVDAPDAVRSI